MATHTMRKHLSKPTSPVAKAPVWAKLYRQAVERATAKGDPRLRDLQHFASNPEKACRSLSILTDTDLNREFPA